MALDESSFKAMNLARVRGRELARKHPKIADMYRSGMILDSLAQEFSPDYERSRSVAINSIWHALRELLGGDELARIAEEHTDDARVRTYKSRIGLGAMTEEALRRARMRSVIAKGNRPYTAEAKETGFGPMDERSYVIFLKAAEGYTWQEVADHVNSIFGNNRSANVLRSIHNQRWQKLAAPLGVSKKGQRTRGSSNGSKGGGPR